MGGLYTAADLIERVEGNTMQMFCLNDSIAVSQIAVYPRKRVLEIIVCVGRLADARVLHERIIEYAKYMDVDLIQAYGRVGWEDDARRENWKVKARGRLYQRIP